MIKYQYEVGVINQYEVLQYVENNTITENEYHDITGYNYQGLKKREND